MTQDSAAHLPDTHRLWTLGGCCCWCRVAVGEEQKGVNPIVCGSRRRSVSRPRASGPSLGCHARRPRAGRACPRGTLGAQPQQGSRSLGSWAPHLALDMLGDIGLSLPLVTYGEGSVQIRVLHGTFEETVGLPTRSVTEGSTMHVKGPTCPPRGHWRPHCGVLRSPRRGRSSFILDTTRPRRYVVE